MGLLERLQAEDTELEDLKEALDEALDSFDEDYSEVTLVVIQDEDGAEHLQATFDLVEDLDTSD